MAGLSQAARRIEQDEAAGGSSNRLVTCADGHQATASIALRPPPGRKGYKVYAYLRWLEHGTSKTRERYVCSMPPVDRNRMLAQAWSQAKDRGLLTPEGQPPIGS
ncbi:hypothetical protein [Rhodococcus sp. IEGM1428]|uniref:hypothetical protein n=1 Tax=Rhodococcus sp. IEGM1428 TaxID=3392191 RepID=UPI003D0D43D6